MSKWYCECCGEIFDEDEIVTETTHYQSNYIGHGGGYSETESFCPNCHSDAIAEAEECECCGEAVKRTRCVGDVEICDDCYETLRGHMKAVVEDLCGEFEKLDSLQVIELVRNFYDD